MILLDTHALLWWALDPEKLSKEATTRCHRMEHTGGFASSISIWELGVKAGRGQLDMGCSIEEFVRRLMRTGVVELVPVTTEVWLGSLRLDWTHRDPADRVIVATALGLGLQVLSKDQAIHDFPGVQCVW